MTPLQKRCQFYVDAAPVFAAGLAGKVLQLRKRGSDATWLDADKEFPPEFSLAEFEYRVKPEPQYRPFTPEEALGQAHRAVSERDDYQPRALYVTRRSGHYDVGVSGSYMSFVELLARYVFADDGSPCGVPVTA